MKTEFLRHQWGRFAVCASALFLVVNSSHAALDPASAAVLDPSQFSCKATFTVAGYTGTEPLTNFPVLVKFAAGSPSGFDYGDCAADGSIP